MNRLRKLFLALGLLVSTLIIYSSCQKDLSSQNNIPQGQQRVQIRLSDNPVNFDAVNVDIQRVEVFVVPDSCRDSSYHHDDDMHYCNDQHHDDDDDDFRNCGVWDTLDIRTGVYNLLNLSNGVDTILANGFTVQGQIKKIRLTLGTHNSVVVDSVSYPLNLWNNFNIVTIKIRGEYVDQISPNDLQLWLDFDAGRSIVKLSNNHFVLRPFLRIWIPGRTASLKGKILPREAGAVVSAISNGDTLIAIPERGNGKFKIRGIRGTTADIFINATQNGYRDTTITGVQLQAGRETDIGTVQLHQ